MSKRKLEEADNNSSKIAKITAEGSSTDACLQNVNEDIARVIVDFLKLSATSLSALSLTCSKWHNQSDTLLNKDLQHLLPISYKACSRKRRNEAIASFTLVCSEASVDLKLFEFPEIAVESAPNNFFQISHSNVIPWAPHIVFVRMCGGYVIVDLNQHKYVGQETVPKLPNMGNSRLRLFSINEKRKQVVISSTRKNGEYSGDEPEYYEWLDVYSVSDNGTVELITKFCVKNDYAVYDYGMSEFSPLNLYLDNTGIIWHSRINEVKRFSIDKNEEIKTDFDLNLLYVIGIGEMDNHVLLFCYDYQNGPVPISIFNTTSKKIVGVLPKSDSIEMDSEEQMKALKVTVRNNLLLLTDEAKTKTCYLYILDLQDRSQEYSGRGHIGIYSVVSLNRILDCNVDDDFCRLVSPGGNKMAKFDDELTEIYLIEGGQFNLVESLDRGQWPENFWIGDYALLQTKDDTFRILNDKSAKEHSLPFNQGNICDWEVSTIGKTVLFAKKDENKKGLSIYHMEIL